MPLLRGIKCIHIPGSHWLWVPRPLQVASQSSEFGMRPVLRQYQSSAALDAVKMDCVRCYDTGTVTSWDHADGRHNAAMLSAAAHACQPQKRGRSVPHQAAACMPQRRHAMKAWARPQTLLLISHGEARNTRRRNIEPSWPECPAGQQLWHKRIRSDTRQVSDQAQPLL